MDFERSTYSIGENDGRGLLSVNVILSRPTAIDIPISISSVDIDTSTVGELCLLAMYNIIVSMHFKQSEFLSCMKILSSKCGCRMLHPQDFDHALQ